ncbi:MAG: cell wall-binding repeat-containing protein, partial [Candidatus Dormibacteria bacterium]
SDTCTAATLAPNATCAIGVTFTPSVSGSASASLSIVDDAPGSPLVVALTGTTTGAGSGGTNRLAGANRIATAIATSTKAFPASGSAGAVVLARADQYPDALAGVPLAAAKGGPLLLSESASLDTATQAEIQRVLPSGGTVYLLGGSGALSTSIDTALQGLHYSATRLAGASRFSTAVAVAKALGDPNQVFEVTGTNFPDAISAGPAAVSAHGAILLTNGSNQAEDTFSYLAAHTGDHRTAIGGPAAAADQGATGVGGPDRFATSAAVATTFFPSPKAVGLATGLDFPDALAGGATMGATGPMLLVSPSAPLPQSVSSYLSTDAKVATSVLVFGGTSVVGDDVVSAARNG